MSEEEFEGMTRENLLAILAGEDPEEAKASYELNQRLNEESRKYINTPAGDWPNITMNWDISASSQRFSLDGATLEEFKNNHPNGFELGFVCLKDIDSILHKFSRRDNGELWTVGSASKLAKLIVYLSEGRPISPPLIKPIESGEVILQGGHHRYAIAKEIGEETIPIHVNPENKSEINKLLTVKWISA